MTEPRHSNHGHLSDLIADVREYVLYLQELGVDSLDITFPDPVSKVAGEARSKSTIDLSEAAAKLTSPAPMSSSRIIMSDLPSLKNLSSVLSHDARFGETVPSLPPPTETVEQIRADIGPNCSRCKLSTLGRRQVVNSIGNFEADLMFVGEAPGADEDQQGEPFVGRAGQLLTKIIESIGLRREDVFIGNINRCRPPGNRAPEPDETLQCKPFLLREIAVVRPKVIVVLGATAAQNLLETKTPISKMRGHFHDYLGVKVMPTFHPAYLLRDPHKKRDVWEDMKMVRELLSSTR